MKKRIHFYRVLLLFASLSCEAFADSEIPFVLRILTEKTVWASDDSVTINASIKNFSQNPIWIALPLDGSSQMFRYPHAFFLVWDARKNPVPDSRKPCKTVDPPTLDGFYLLKIGEQKELFPGGFSLNPFIGRKQGVYYVACVYSTNASRDAEWFGLYSDEYWKNRNDNPFWKKRSREIARVLRRIRRIPKMHLVSDTIRIEIRAAVHITQEKALEIGKAVCHREGWKWEDVQVEECQREWIITTHANRLGGNVHIRIDNRTGAVLEKIITGP